MIGSSIRHWFKHLKYGTQDYTDAYESGLRSGNLQYAAYAFGHDMYCRFYQGVPLANLMRDTRRSLEFSRTRTNQWAIDLLEGGLSVFGALSGKDPASNGNDDWSEQQFLQRVEEHHNIQVTCIYKVLKTFSLLVSGDCEGALVESDEAEPLIYTVGTQGLLPWPEHVFARLLILTALYSKAEATQQTQWHTDLDVMIGRLRMWADNCPENFEHKYLLAAAELARIDGRSAEAMQLYDRAVEAAQAGNFLQWESMANERASAFWLERGNERLAHIYWQQAYVCYNRWGAVTKVCSMETAYRTALAKSIAGGGGSGKPAGTFKPEITNGLLDTQIEQLRKNVLQAEQAKLRIATATQAAELAHAMQRVRVEIADRKQAEEALNNAKAKLELALQSSKMGVWMFDIVKNKRTYDHQACLLLGIDPATFSGSAEDFFAAVHPDDHETIKATLEQSIKQNVPYEPEYRAVWPDGTVHYITARGKLLMDGEGNPQAINGVIWDITERKRQEAESRELGRQLQEGQKLAAVGTLACGMGHEINNPIMGIINYAQLIKDRLQGKNEVLVEFAGEIVIEAERIAGIVRGLSAFATRDIATCVAVPVSDLVEAALSAKRATLSHDHITLTVDVPADLPTVSCDRRQIVEVLTGLLSNARDALNEKYPGHDENKKVVISATKMTMSLVNGDLSLAKENEPNNQSPITDNADRRIRAVRFTVEDQGTGIPDAVREHIFEPFFTTKDKSVGAGSVGKGLGLFVSYATVQEHGGVLSVESEVGQWTRVHVELPVVSKMTRNKDSKAT
jgi:PAS domain S-box-containing protein